MNNVIAYLKQRLQDKQAELALAAIFLGGFMHFTPESFHQMIATVAAAFGILLPETWQDFWKDLGIFLGATGLSAWFAKKTS